MSEVIVLSEVRARRRPVPSFDGIMEQLFHALDLMEEVRGAEAAHAVVCEAIEMALTREERMLLWTRK